jgi:metal-dependent HD superfamily phosphatase/phosphodiesterase
MLRGFNDHGDPHDGIIMGRLIVLYEYDTNDTGYL